MFGGVCSLRHRAARRLLTASLVVLVIAGACGPWRSFDAHGLVFEYPDRFQTTDLGDRRTLVLRAGGEEPGVIAVRWSETGQPDARDVLGLALRAEGREGRAYDRVRFEQLASASVGERSADYVELVLERGAGGDAPAYYGRVLLVAGPDGTRYLVAYLVPESRRDEGAVLRVWRHVRDSLAFESGD